MTLRLNLRDIERLENTSFASVASAAVGADGPTLELACFVTPVTNDCIDLTLGNPCITDSSNCVTGGETLQVDCYITPLTNDCLTIGSVCSAEGAGRLLAAVRTAGQEQ